MLVFLCGQDTYRSQKKLEEIIEKHKKTNKGGLSLRYFYGGEFDFRDLKNESETSSMFKEKKLLVVKDAFSDKKFKEEFLESGKKFIESDTLILFHESNNIDKRDILFKFLQKNAEFQEFLPLEREKLADWMEKEIKSFGADIDAQALGGLISCVGNDLWQAKQEIMKLVNFAKNKRIKKEDIDILVKPKIENDIFETIDSIAKKEKKKALFLIHRHIEKGDSPLYLLSMMNFQFRNLLEIRDFIEKKLTYNEILKKSSLHPFVVKKTYWQAQKFSFLQLKKIYHKIFQIDLAIKTGKINPKIALDVLIAGL